MIWALYDRQLQFVALVISIIHEHGPSNGIRHQLRSKKDLGSTVLAITIAAKCISHIVHH